MRIPEQIFAGLIILTVTLMALGAMPFPLLMLAFIAPGVAGLLNLVWFAVIGAMVFYAFRSSKPGLALAPVLFVALWAGAAVVSQWRVQASIDPKLLMRPTSTEASAQRTLIVHASQSVDRKIIADGHVDRLINVAHDNANQKISGIEEISLASGDACSVEPKPTPTQLQATGRADTCFKSRSLAEIPDGLVIEQFFRIGIQNGAAGCCNETQARLRIGGKERPLFSWYQGQAYVLSYLPVFGFFPRSTHLWEAGSGILHPVRYGPDDIDPITMVSAIYGVAPPYQPDRSVPSPQQMSSAAETLDQAVTFARQANVSPKSVAALLIAARNKGLVDERSIDAAASLAGHDYDSWMAVTEFAKGLTSEQTELLLDKVLKRLETPDGCDECVASQSAVVDSLRDWKLEERLADPKAFRDRAIRIFVERHDLAMWQYEGCLRIITSMGPRTYPASVSYLEKAVLPLIFLDDTPAYSDKAIAMLRGYPRRPGEATKFAAKLDLVHDRDLKEYMVAVWGYELTKLPQRNASPETYAIATKACARIARISDRALRVQNFGVDCPVPTYQKGY